MNKALEALEKIIQCNDLRNPVRGQADAIDVIEIALKEREKQDEILKIIKKKNPDLEFIRRCFDYDDYIDRANWLFLHPNKLLMENEFYLLKEFLTL